MRDQTVTGRVLAFLIFPVFLGGGFLSVVLFLREFHPEAGGFDQEGSWLLLYNLSRLGLMLFLILLCFSVGYFALHVLSFDLSKRFHAPRKLFILCFFLGASMYGILFAALGLAGLISLGVGLTCTLPVLAFSYEPVRALLNENSDAYGCLEPSNGQENPFAQRASILVAVGTGVLVVLTRVIFVGTTDNNIWEHYLHYYRQVLATGSTLPNEVWHHFYACKGAGLIFLANVLSDFFGAQLVSGCFIAVAGLIILDLLWEYCGSLTWACLGVTLFFAFLFGDVSAGAMLQSHVLLLGYASLAVWGGIWLQRIAEDSPQPLQVVLLVSLTYLGFYMPIATAMFSIGFAWLSLSQGFGETRRRSSAFLILGCGMFVGSALAMLVNWSLTGLPDVTPMRLFWPIANREKVEEVFGMGGIEFFLARNSDLSVIFDKSFKSAWKVLRYPLPMVVIVSSLLGYILILIRDRTRGVVASSDRLFVQVIGFLLALSALAQIIQNSSINRMALYSIILVSLALVVMLKRLSDASVTWLRWPGASSLIVGISIGVAIAQASLTVGYRWPTVLRYAFGTISIREVFREMESAGNLAPGMSTDAISEMRKTIREDERILRLTYDSGYYYGLPGQGIVSEPTYSIVRDPRKLLEASPLEVAEYLRLRKIDYFTISVHSSLFSTIAFTSLFDVQEMSKFFSVAYEDGDFFVLTWRDKVSGKPLPDRLLTVFELKRTGVLHYPFSQHFERSMDVDESYKRVPGDSSSLVDGEERFMAVRERFQSDLHWVFSAEVLSRVSLEGSRAVLVRVWEAGKQALSAAEPGELVRARWDVGGRTRIVENISERELRNRLLTLFKEAIYRKYKGEWGEDFAELERRCDERFPFAIRYPPHAKCL